MKNRAWLLFRILTFVILILFSILCLYPILWLITSSLKTNSELYSNPWGFAAVPQWENYARAIIKGKIGRSFLNSIYITGISVVVTTLLSAMTSYGIMRLKWKLSHFTRMAFLFGMSIPSYAAIIPLFAIFNRLGMLGNFSGVIVAHIAFTFPISIFILSGFFSTLPRELEEAAIIDGCSVLSMFFKIMFPISISSIVTVVVINFISIWNDLLFPQIFLSNQNMMPLPVGLTLFADLDSIDYTGMLAAVVFTVVPTIIGYVILHEKIMEGMTAGAVKG